MKSLELFLLVTFFLAFGHGNILPIGVLTPEKEVDLMSRNISAFDDFLASHNFEAEHDTCHLSCDVIDSLQRDIVDELGRVKNSTILHQQELANSLARDSSAQNCLKDVDKIFEKKMNKGAEEFKRCVRLASPVQEMVFQKFLKRNKEYSEKKEKVIAGLKSCKTNFPNEVYKDQRTVCLKSIYADFFEMYKSLPEAEGSPCMKNFEETVLKCVTEITTKVSKIIYAFPKKLGICAQMTDNDHIESEMSKIEPITFQPNVTEQVKKLQTEFKKLEESLNATLRNYYNLEYEAKNTYVFAQRSEKDFQKILEELLSPHTRTIQHTLDSNPGSENERCGIIAKNKTHSLIKNASQKYVFCDQQKVNHTKNSIDFVRLSLSYIANTQKNLGNVAILECFKEGLIFSDNMIDDCYQEKHDAFFQERNSSLKEVGEIVKELMEDIPYYKHPGSPIPCGEEERQKTLSDAKRIRFSYRKCMYKATGTDYPVTIPTTTTTTGYLPTDLNTEPKPTSQSTSTTTYFRLPNSSLPVFANHFD